VGAATAVTGGGPAGVVEFQTGNRIDTPSGTFQEVTSLTFTAAAGPLVVRFSGAGSELDTNSLAEFVGRAYASMRVRVLLNGVPLAPGAVTFIDNTGKIRVRATRPRAASFEWAGTVSAPGQQTVAVQFRNLHSFDSATLTRWTLTVQHA
jgi:hypothetical protein